MIQQAELRSLFELRLSSRNVGISDFFDSLSKYPDRQKILNQLHCIGQLEAILAHPSFSIPSLNALLDCLVPVDAFYKEMGGIEGYHAKIHSLLRKEPEGQSAHALFHAPTFIDISVSDEKTQQAVLWGIEAMPEMAEIFPLGGAADRLHLIDDVTGAELPAAKLKFLGKTLLERLVCDVQARERLYYFVHGKQIITPIAIMTSLEKANHFHVRNMLEENEWFGRPKESFRIFTQPLVPVVDEKGNWIFTEDLMPLMKPGGHGAIWKMAYDQKIFAWLESLGRKKALVRQINNPVAGLDYGLLAFIGIGWKRQCKFGFASCPRLLKAAEGVNVLIERKHENRNSLVLSNIEYCDFEKFGIEDMPLKEGEPYSRFSSNTNILFVDLPSIQTAVEQCPFPGLLLNLKKGSFVNAEGCKEDAYFGRLESTMQNIADVFVEEKQESLLTKETFITYNHRHKTIATTKRAFVSGGNLQETPESCFYDFLFAARELLEHDCGFDLPSRRSLLEYLDKGPEFVFLYHPSLGPLYQEIARKIQRGALSLGAEWVLEISDLFVSHLSLDGSLRIMADRIFGEKNERGEFVYSHNVGRCILRNVKIENRGVDWGRSSPFWKGDFVRREGVEILLKGKSEFIAEDVIFTGSHRFEVEDGRSLRVSQGSSGLSLQYTEFSPS